MKVERSSKAFERAKKVLPGGVNSPVRSFREVGGTPRFIQRGKGAYLWDLDGHRYIDYCQSWGAMILGHAHPAVTRAAAAALRNGSSYGAATPGETDLAELIRRAVPSMQRVRFVSSGTEAVMSAARLARGYTQRSKIVKFAGGYHGHADQLLVTAGSGLAAWPKPSSAGVPDCYVQETVSVPFNNPEAVSQAFKKYGDKIAAVIVEPVPANMGVVPPEPGFLKFLRAITREHGALLVFDEVITGFRLRFGGAQNEFGIRPDLTCLGKIIGGGLPAAAYGGSRAMMSLLSPLGPVYQAGTLSGNPVAMAAGLATIKQLASGSVHAALNAKAARFVERLRERLAPLGVRVNAQGSMFTMFFTTDAVRDFSQARSSDIRRFAHVYHRCLEQGVYLSPAPFEANFISAAHTDKDLETTLHAIETAVKNSQ